MRAFTSAERLKALWWPNALRTLVASLIWCVCLALYMHALETMGVADPGKRFGLERYLTINLISGLTSWLLTMGGWYLVASRVWSRSEAARTRYAMDGIYALLPWPIQIPLLGCLTLAAGTLSYVNWTTYMAWTGSLPPTLRAQANLGSSLTVSFFCYLVLYFIDFIRVRAAMQRIRAETAQRLSVQAQLQRLQAQMEPHMLFNTLANLHALIETQPGKAQDMLSHLIDYLRATLSASRTGALPLREEIARVQDYLALMQIRMGDRLRVQLDVPAALCEIALPPMLVQPLVENAIKHGLDPLPQGGELIVCAQREGDMLVITVQDNGQGLEAAQATPSASGFGLGCIRALLHTSWGSAATLTLRAHAPGPGTVATLRIPANGPALPSPPFAALV